MTSTINIQTLTNTVDIKLNYKVINFYVITLDKYYPLNGMNIGIDKVYTSIQNELYNSLYHPIKNELFNNDYLQDKHLNDFNEIFETLILNGHYFDYSFTVDSLLRLLNNQLNKLFIRIKKNRMKKTILTEIENNNNFILDLNYLKYYKHLDNTHIAQMIIDAPFTQLLSYFYYYEDISIDYNSDTLNSIVLDIHNLITTKPFYNRLLKTINVELDLLDCTK